MNVPINIDNELLSDQQLKVHNSTFRLEWGGLHKSSVCLTEMKLRHI